MNQTAPGTSLSAANPSDRLAGAAHWLVSGLAVACFLFVLVTLLVLMRVPGNAAGWPEAVLVLAATLSTVVSQARRLPLQNVILAAGVIACIGGTVHSIGAVTAIPFGPFSY